MGYQMQSGRFARTDDITLREPNSAAVTATFATSAVEGGDRSVARLVLDVTAASGTSPTLDVVVQTSRDGVTWYTAGTFTQATAVVTRRLVCPIDRFVRAQCTVGGTTPSFTFTLSGELA